MPNVSFKIGPKNIEIACSEGEQDKIKKLAKSIDIKYNNYSEKFTLASHELIMGMLCLMMQDEIENLKQGVNPEIEKYEENQKELVNTLEQVTEYLEKLADAY